MTHPHDPHTDDRRDDREPSAETHPATKAAGPTDAPSPAAAPERRPRLSLHPRPHLRRLGRGALAAVLVTGMVLLTTTTLRYSRQSLEAVAADAPPAPLATRPLDLRRIEELSADPLAPPPLPEPAITTPPAAPPPLHPSSPAAAARRPDDHRAAWRAPLTQRATARRSPAPSRPSAADSSLSPDLAASLRALATDPALDSVSWAGTPGPPPAGNPPTAQLAPASPPVVLAGAATPPPADRASSANLLPPPPPPSTRLAVPTAPPSPYLLRAGTLLPAVLSQRVVSDQPGIVRAVVARDVRDSLADAHLLVPRGTVLLGRQGTLPAFGQGRLAVVWTRLLFPDGRSLDLDPGGSGAASASRDGTAGLAGRVRHHWGRRYAAAALLSLVGAGVQLSQPQSGSLLDPTSPGAQAAGALGLELGRTSTDILRRYADLPPTIELAPGARVHAVLVDDLAFASPYHPTVP